MNTRFRLVMRCFGCAAAMLVCGCGGGPKAAPPPPPRVVVSVPEQRTVTEYVYLTGNAQAVESVDLQARVSGYLRAVNFKDGDFVKKGDLLFVIEPEPYEARVRLAEAGVAAAQAALVRARLEYDRQAELVKKNATSQAEVEKWQAGRDASQADLDKAKANLDVARIDLGYTQITAPFDGRMDKRLRDPGALVGVGTPTMLSTIRRVDPIYAYFNANEKDLVQVRRRQLERGDTATYKDRPMQVFLEIEGEQGYPHEGTIDFASSSLDTGTGTLELRGAFANPVTGKTPQIIPGMFVRLRVPVDTIENALLVPDQALGTEQGGRFAFVVTAQNTVEQRPVTLGSLEDGGLRVVTTGLKPDDLVVVEGFQRVRRGAAVAPVRKSDSPERNAGAAGTAQPAAAGSK